MNERKDLMNLQAENEKLWNFVGACDALRQGMVSASAPGYSGPRVSDLVEAKDRTRKALETSE